MKQLPSKTFKDPLHDLLQWLENDQILFVIIGGVASSLLGRPRLTKDIDLVVIARLDNVDRLMKNGKQFGFEPRISDAAQFAKSHRVLLMKHAPSKIEVDISFGALPFEEEMIKNRILLDIDNLTLPLPRPEDLIIMKAIPRRPRDATDIEGLIDANPHLDFKRIRKWVREFAKVLEMPEIYNDLEKLLKAAKKK